MKKVSFLLVCVSIAALTGCAPTITHFSVSETVAPDGRKSTTTTREITQTISTPKTEASDKIIDMK